MSQTIIRRSKINMPSNVDYDIVVVGAGPAGSTTARIAAKSGLKVLLVDKKQELGSPIQCSGAVSAHALLDVDVVPDSEFISTAIKGFKIYHSTGNYTEIDYQKINHQKYQNGSLGYVVDRRRFDRHLMMLAERAGTEVWLKTEADGYSAKPDGIAKINLKRFGKPLTIRTKVIVGADGIQSQVGKWAKLRTHIKLGELASCLQYIMNNIETSGLLEIITGHEWAPGGYAWIFPKGNGYAEVGLGVARTMTTQDAHWHLDHFIKKSFLSERFKHARILEVQGGGVPLTSPLKKQFADNIILVGDAARHVNPITGGGIHTALRCGVIAGNFLAKLLLNGNNATADNLAQYQQIWMTEIGSKMWELYKIKQQIFLKEIPERDQILYETLSGYFKLDSEFRKI